jgi:hypothetical protein
MNNTDTSATYFAVFSSSKLQTYIFQYSHDLCQKQMSESEKLAQCSYIC